MSGAGYGAASYGYNAAQAPYNFDPSYGGGMMKPARPRAGVNGVGILVSFLVPWFLFMFIFTVQSFSIHYDNPNLAHMVTMLAMLVVGVLGYSALVSWRRRQSGEDAANWTCFLFLTATIAFLLALSAGSYNFSHNMTPFYDVNNLNVYPSVDPATSRGQQFMDAGRFVFTPDSRLDLQHSVGFKNLDTYCVSPIISGDGTMESYDFWAVGVNCCSGHVADFACGEFNNPRAQSGLRLMRDDLRSFFRLAVQQAEASYNIKAAHPIFVYWMQDPIAEINAYQDDGCKFYLTGVFCHLAFQAFCTAAAVFVFSKA